MGRGSKKECGAMSVIKSENHKEIEKTCDNCMYEKESIIGEHCRFCIHNATEHFKSKSDDVCEWESVSDGEFIKNPHTKRLYSNEPSMKNIYCNTCGKKIKVVDL